MGSLTKALIGKEDCDVANTNTYETFNRLTSTGSTITMTSFPDIWKTAQGAVNAKYYTPNDATGVTLNGAVGQSVNNSCKDIYVEAGEWLVTNTYDWSSYTTVKWVFAAGAYLTISAGCTVTFPSPDSIMAQPDQQIFSLTGTGAVRFGKSGDHHVGWWGAKGDCTNAGVGTDDATELQAAIDCARATYDTTALVGSRIKGIRGRIYLSTATLWAGRNAGTDGKWLYAIEDLCVYGKHTSVILDYTGAHGKHLNNVTLIGDATTIPTMGLLLARRNADLTGNSAGQTYMTRVNIQGSYSVAGFVSFSSEELDMNSCRVEVAAGEFAALFTDTGYYYDSAGAWQQLTCPNQDVWSGKITFTDHYIRRSRFSHSKAAPSGASALIQCLGTAQFIMTDCYFDDTANDMPLIQFHQDPAHTGAAQTNPTLDGVTFHGTYTHGVEFKATAVRPIIQNCKWGTVTGVGGADVYVAGVNLYDAEIETDIFDASTAGSDLYYSNILKINTSINAVRRLQGELFVRSATTVTFGDMDFVKATVHITDTGMVCHYGTTIGYTNSETALGPGNIVLPAASLIGGYIQEDPEGAANWTTDTAANIIAAIPDAKVGSSFTCYLHNAATNGSSEVVTLVGGTDVTLRGELKTLTEGKNTTAQVFFVVTSTAANLMDAVIITGEIDT